MIVKNNYLISFATLFLIFIVYFYSFYALPINISLQYKLAQSFLNGQTYIAELPELSSEIDPYDPSLKIKYPSLLADFHDSSWYNGKIYLYYGPIPALTFFIPSILLHINSTDLLAVLFYSFGSLIFISLIFLKLLRFDNDNKSRFFWFFPIIILNFAIASPLYFMIYRPMVYEVAIASSNFFIILGLFFLINKIFFNKKDCFLVFSSICFIFSVGCRLTTLIASLIFILVAIIVSWQEKSFKRQCIYLTLPFIIGYCLLLLYNYIRFDSFFEFGISYILSNFYPLDVISGFPKNHKLTSFFELFSYYLFNFVHFDKQLILKPNLKIINYIICNEIGIWGLLSCFPTKWSLCLLPKIYKLWLNEGQKRLIILSISLLLSSFATLILLSLVPLIAYRYLTNINFYLTFAAILFWSYYSNQLWFQNADTRIANQKLYIYFDIIFIICSIISICVGLLSVYVGYTGNIYLYN
jgi:hypothetical protein